MFKKINTWYIFDLFFENPFKKFSVREMARIFNLSPATISKDLEFLRKQGFLKLTRKNLYKFYSCDFKDDFVIDLKLFYNLQKIKKSNFLKDLINLFGQDCSVVFFGPGLHGKDGAEDVFYFAVFSENFFHFNHSKNLIFDIKNYEELLKRKIKIFHFRNFKSCKNKNLLNAIINGFVLYGKI